LVQTNNWWLAKGGKASALLLIAALAVELVAQASVNVRSGQIIAILNNETANARSEIEKIKRPRALSDEQVSNFLVALTPFAGTQFDCAVTEGDPEAANFLYILEAILLRAGWKETDWNGGDIVAKRQGKPTWGYFTLQTVGVGYDETRASSLAHPANALGALLSVAGFGGHDAVTGAAFINKYKDSVHLVH